MSNENNENDFSDKELDELLKFRPITKGLGFHHGSKEEQQPLPLQKKEAMLKRSLEQQMQKMQSPQFEVSPDLKMFYDTSTENTVSQNTKVLDLMSVDGSETKLIKNNELKLEQSYEPATWTARSLAFVLDLICILIFSSIMTLPLFVSVSFDIGLVLENFSISELALLAFPMLFMTQIFYFTLLDKTAFSTVGKHMLGIKTVTLENQNTTMLQSFMRIMLIDLSLLSLGLTAILDFQGKLTNTKVVKVKK